MKECAQAALDKGTTVASQYIQRMNNEAQRKTNRAIAAALPSKRSKVTSQIEVPHNLDDDRSVCDTYERKDDVEKWASCHINRNFRQVYNTPPGKGIFREEFGLLSDTPAADAVLEGTYETPEGMDKHLALLLQHLKRPEAIKMFNPEVTMEEVKGACKSMKEKTTSSPEGLHFGHFVVMGEDDFLCQVLAWIISAPLVAGLSPQQ